MTSLSMPKAPTVPGHLASASRRSVGTIEVDEDRCKGCALCVAVCPKHVIELAARFTPRGYHPAALIQRNDEGAETCTGCMICATICPDAAITVFRAAPARKAS